MPNKNVKRCPKCGSLYPTSDGSCPSCSESIEVDSYSTESSYTELPGAGYIYVLLNPSMEGKIKIGKTARHPEERAKELSSSTGVPTSFVVAYHKYFQDCEKAEKFVHSRLDSMNHKISNNREFFDAPLNVAIDVIIEAWNYFSQPRQQAVLKQSEVTAKLPSRYHGSLDDEPGAIVPEPRNPWDFDLQLAHAYHYGDGDTLQDYSKALKHYVRAANLGSHKACYEIGRMYECGYGVEKNIEKALKYFKEAVEKGSLDAYVSMADIYEQLGHRDNSIKCWTLLFNSQQFRDAMDRWQRREYFLQYLISYGNIDNIPEEHLSPLQPFKEELIKIAYDRGYDRNL